MMASFSLRDVAYYRYKTEILRLDEGEGEGGESEQDASKIVL
jgi:hypothetical protein